MESPGAPVIGTSLKDRYFVGQRAWRSPVGQAFAGRDRVLDRPVLVFPLPVRSAREVTAFASRYAQVQHPDLLRVYDALFENGSGWLVAEHPPGGRLPDHMERGRLPVPVAARIVRDLARALGALHERGLIHGAVGPELVLLDSEGRTKLAGAGLALAGPDGPALAGPDGSASGRAGDVSALGALAYQLFTGVSPGSPKPKSPPPTIAALLDRLMASDFDVRPTLDEVATTLAPYVEEETPERPPGFLRQEARWLAPAALVVAVGIASVILGLRIDFGGKGFPIKISRNPGSQTSSKVTTVHELDPQGNGQHPLDATLASDGDELTAWKTLGYATAGFGGLKTGLGLVFDLGSSQRVGRIRVLTSLPGWTAEWRVSETDASSPDAFTTVVTPFVTSKEASSTLAQPRSGRYWLLWITSLVSSDTPSVTPTGTSAATSAGNAYPYHAWVNEVQFFAP